MNTDKIYAEQLANEYALRDTSKVVALRKLDKKAELPATVFTYTFGIIAALIAGVGMCLSMKVIGNGSFAMFVLGVIVGIIGLLGMGVNYPIYKKLLEQGKRKYAFEIMASGKWELERIITHVFPLNELEQAIRTASDVDHAGNVVVKMKGPYPLWI